MPPNFADDTIVMMTSCIFTYAGRANITKNGRHHHTVNMNPKFTATEMALALSTSVVVESNSISTVEEVKPFDREKNGTEIRKFGRKTEQNNFFNTPDGNGISADGDDIEVDVGILAGEDGYLQRGTMPLFGRRHPGVKVASSSFSIIPRFLQVDEQPKCAYPETCEPNLCACTAKGGYAYDCAAELSAVCNKVYDADGTVWTLDGCTGNVKYYANTYCPFAKCIVDGGSYGECFCQFYQIVCDLYGGRQKYEVSSSFGRGVVPWK